MKRLPWWRRPYFVKQVLDIGAGHNPFHGVTHVLDYDVHEGRERGQSQVVVPRSARLIVGNATDLPFQTGAFDYVYASHILEHVNFPDRAPEDPAALSGAIIELLSHPERLIEGGRQGRIRIHSAFTIEAETQALESIYRFLLKDESSTDKGTSPRPAFVWGV